MFWDDEDERWNEIDALIFKESIILAIALLRESTQEKPSYPELSERIYLRQEQLEALFPERFPIPLPRISPREEAEIQFSEISSPVAVIEGWWNGDTVNDWYVSLSVITNEASKHPRYSSKYLCSIVYTDALSEDDSLPYPGAMVQLAREIGEDFAARAGVEFSPPTDEVDDEAPR